MPGCRGSDVEGRGQESLKKISLSGRRGGEGERIARVTLETSIEKNAIMKENKELDQSLDQSLRISDGRMASSQIRRSLYSLVGLNVPRDGLISNSIALLSCPVRK